MENKEKYNEVKSRLKEKRQRGDIKAIAKTLGKNPVYVSSILSPSNNSYNDQIIAEAVKLVTDRERSAERMLKQLGV